MGCGVREEVIGDSRLVLGDARDLLPTLSPVDCVVTDPPYRVTKGGFQSHLKLEGGFGGWLKEYGNQGDIVQCDLEFSDWLPLVYGALKADAQAYFMINGRSIKDLQTDAETAGFKFHTLLVWDKRAALPNRYYQNVTEFALFVFKGRARTIRYPASKNLYSLFQRDESGHPTEKPVSLMELWISNSSDTGDTVLDPFMGSGTTGVAAVHLGRRFIGCELVQEHFDTACRRIEEAYRNPRLLRPAPEVELASGVLL